MAYTKQEIKGISIISGIGTASGTDTYTVSIPEVSSYIIGMHLVIKFTNANTTSATLNVNGIGAANILKGVLSTLNVGDILANQEMMLAYDGASFQLINGTTNQTVNSVANNLFNYYNFK